MRFDNFGLIELIKLMIWYYLPNKRKEDKENNKDDFLWNYKK